MQSLLTSIFRILPAYSQYRYRNMIITLGSSFTLRAPPLGYPSTFTSRVSSLRSTFTSTAAPLAYTFNSRTTTWASPPSPYASRIVVRSVATLPDPPITAAPTKKKEVELAAVKIVPQNVDTDLAPIIMLHGVLASTKTYSSLLRRDDFAPGRVKYGLDLRNHGSSPHLSGMSYADQAADVASALRSLDLPRSPILVGHSMGGKVAMTLALTEPNMVSSLVVVDIAPMVYKERPGDPTSPTIALAAMSAIDLDKCTSRSDVDTALNVAGLTNGDVRAFVMTNLQRNNLGFSWKCNVDELAQGIRDIVSFPEFNEGENYTGRTMLIRGGKSQYVPFSAMRKTTQLFPRTKLVTFSEAGHWLQAQQPDMFVESVNSFLETVK